MSNDTLRAEGRLANHVIRNTVCSLLAEKYQLKFAYGYEAQLDRLGIPLYKSGTKSHDSHIHLVNEDFLRYFLNEDLGDRNIWTNGTFFQTNEIADYLRAHFASDAVKKSIMDHNTHRARYENNDDVFVHIRLGDVIGCCPCFEYFDRALQQLTFSTGYISSDTISHDICVRLMQKYGLKPLAMDEVETIMFGSTCRNVVLSNGTFGWTIGVLSWFSTVFCPNLRLFPAHHPVEIYDFADWRMIDHRE
jgi:hypothetical protein